MKELISLLIAIVIALVVTFLIKLDSDSKIEAIRESNKVLELRCDSLVKLNDSIHTRLDFYSQRIDSMKILDKKLSDEYAESQKQIINIKQKYENNKRIDNFSTPDIIKYFTDSL